MTFGQSETSHVSTMWGHWWETTDMPPNPQANDVFIHRTAMWRPLITPCLETRSLGNRRCFFPPPHLPFFIYFPHLFCSGRIGFYSPLFKWQFAVNPSHISSFKIRKPVPWAMTAQMLRSTREFFHCCGFCVTDQARQCEVSTEKSLAYHPFKLKEPDKFKLPQREHIPLPYGDTLHLLTIR